MIHGFGDGRFHRHVMGTGVNPSLREDSAGPRLVPDSSVCQLTVDRGVGHQSVRTSNALDTAVDWSTMRLLSNRYPFADTSDTYHGFLNPTTCQPATPLHYYRQTSYASNQRFHNNQPFPVSSVEIFPHTVFTNVENAAKRRWSDENGNTLPSAGRPVAVGCLPRQVARQLPVYSSVSSTPMTFAAAAEHTSVDRDFTWMPKLIDRCPAGQHKSSSVIGDGNATNSNNQRLFTEVPSAIASTPTCFPPQSHSTTDLHAQSYDVTDAGQTSIECNESSSFPPHRQAEFSRPLSDVSPSALSAVPVKGRWYFGSDITAESSAVGFEDAVTTNSSFSSPPTLPPTSLLSSTSARPELLPLPAYHCDVRKQLSIKSQEQGSEQLNDEFDQQHVRQRAAAGTVLEYSDEDYDGNDDDNSKLTPKQIRQRKFQFGSRPTAASMSIGKTRTREKYRTVYNERQKLQLEADYVLNTYITADGKAAIARKTGLSERQVKIWFQNRRAKDRRLRHRRNAQNCTSTTTSPEMAAGSICLSTSDSTLPVPLDFGC